jgi:hypothetical protein
MTMQGSGPIYMSQVNHEIGLIPDNGNIWMDHDWLRTLAGRPGSGTYIAFSDFYNKSWYIPMTAYGTDGYSSGAAASTAFTAYCYPKVTPSRGSGGYTYQWAFEGSANGFTLGSPNGQQCQLSQRVTRGGIYISTTVRCTITDSTGHQITVGGIVGTLDYGAV